MDLVIISAISENDVMGFNGGIPWYLPEDLERFRELTLNNPVIMGRNTYDSILERKGGPLDERINIVLTSRPVKEGRVITENCLGRALLKALKYGKDVYFIGGRRVYEDVLPIATKIELTRVHKNIEGSVFFPEVNWGEWHLNKGLRTTSKNDGLEYSFLTYKRIKSG